MGGTGLHETSVEDGLAIGAFKILLDEPALPDLEELTVAIRTAHAVGRPVAIHTVTRTELLFALAALESAGARTGDRLEHASVAPEETLVRFARLGLTIVTQPNFVAERGDAYLRDVDERDRPGLYRVRSLLEAGVAVGGGTDAPFGEADPWRAMQAAVDRRTPDGSVLGPDERVAPEIALELFTSSAHAPGGPRRRVAVGQRADLCLLDLPWSAARTRLASTRVRGILVAGEPFDASVEP
jgi:predicted amidohydrolase YtcJ